MSVRDLEGVDSRWVGPSGPDHADLAYAAEHPGKEEVKAGLPLVGPSGEINWQLARKYGGVDRLGAYVTNWRKIPFSAFEKKNLTAEERAEWDALLNEELVQIGAKTTIALGSYATEALLGPGYSLFWANGVPYRRADGMVVIPVVNAAAGLHDSTALDATAEGYRGVRRYLAGEVEARPAGEWRPGPTTVRWESGTQVWTIGDGRPLAIDTEGSKEEPFCLTFAWEPDRAYIIYAHETEKLRRFAALLARYEPLIILHNSIHDAGVLRAMGIEVWDFDVVDTMVHAYLLQDLPKGLKELTRRLFHIQMTDYKEVVEPWRAAADEGWLGAAYRVALPDVREVQQFTPKGKPRISKGLPVFKREGPPIQLSLVKHVERRQQLAANEQVWAENHIGKRPGLDLKLVPPAIAEDYAGKDAGVTIRLYGHTSRRINAEGLTAVADLDHLVLPMIEDMQNTGLHIDIDRYGVVMSEISARKQQLIEDIRQLLALEDFPGADEFNPASGDQVADFCNFIFKRDRKLGLEKLTRSGLRESTDHSVLSQLREDHAFIDLELEFREHDKYEGTYLLPLGPLIQKMGPDEWRVFTNLRQTTVVSGRLSAHAPNVLAWPARTPLGMRLRSIFTAPAGLVMGSWDLSQIELRLAAALSGDPVMTKAFLDGLDLHSNLAAALFKVSYDEADGGPDQKGPGRQMYRVPAKNIHYMLFYGGGGDKLFEMLRTAGNKLYSREQCFQMMADTARVYKVAIRFLRHAGQEARDKGYVTDYMGRRRFLAGASLMGRRWPVFGLFLEAERQAGNFKIQGAASETLKQAMVTVWQEVYPKAAALSARFRVWLQIHDELMGELDPLRWAEINEMMVGAMTQNSWLTHPIPIETKGKMGKSWDELK